MNIKSTIFILIFSLLSLTFLFPVLVEAQAQGSGLTGQIVKQIDEGAKGGGLGEPVSPQFIIVKIIKMILAVTGSIFLALVFYGGFVYVNSRGDEEQAKKAQKIITGSIIGLAIILLSYSITLFIGS